MTTKRQKVALVLVVFLTGWAIAIPVRLAALGRTDPRDPVFAGSLITLACICAFLTGWRWGARRSHLMGQFVGYMEGQADADQGLYEPPLPPRPTRRVYWNAPGLPSEGANP
jgi:hypothetical protein